MLAFYLKKPTISLKVTNTINVFAKETLSIGLIVVAIPT